MREIVFDTETTGLDPRTGDRMVEIGCVEMVNRVATGRVYHEYFNPDRDMPAEAEAVHGLSAIFLSEKPRFAQKAQDFLDFIGDAPLVAHNAELGLCGREAVCSSRMIDTVQIAKRKHPGAKLSLDALCTRYGIDRSHRTKHGALLDAELLAQLYVELTGGRQIGLELLADATVIETAHVFSETAVVRREFRPARPHAASVEEIDRHRAFIATLKDPIWNEGAVAG